MSNMKDIDDVDDDLFIAKRPQDYIFAEKKVNDINERTSRMLLNTRTLVQESETIGQSTLEQLSSQRESLERVENDLDSINSMTRFTQKNLNNMRSFFGGIKSLFSSNSANAGASALAPSTKMPIPRSATLAHVPSYGPADSPRSPSIPSGNHQNTLTKPAIQPASLSTHEIPPADEFDANLSEIGFGLGRLKEMAKKLGEEIGDQNEMLDRITEKSERAGDSVKHQTRQMQQLLKKG